MGVAQDNWPATVGLVTGLLAKEVVVGTLNTLYTQNQANNTFNPESYHVLDGLTAAWQQTKAGFSGMFSKSMLNPFTANEAEHNMTKSAMGNMQNAFTSAFAAFAYLLFVLLYVPCVSTMGTIAREIGTKWACFSSAWSLSVAYSAAVIFYQLSILLESPRSSLAWILGLIIANALWIYGLLRWGSFRKMTNNRQAEKPVILRDKNQKTMDCHW